MEEWIRYRAIDFCASVTDGTHDSPKPNETGHYLITSKHLRNNSIDFSSAYRISEEDYQKVIQRSQVVQYDILFSMIGTIGNTVRVTTPFVDFAVKNMAIFKMGGNELKSKWLYYWLQSDFAKEYISSRLAGSTQSYLTLDSLRNFPVVAPDEKTMTRIVDILSSIDSKIEINNRINHNLEEQAQALYKSWFVDFEPFKGGEFADSELGLIPAGWRVGTLSELGDIVAGGTPPKSKPEYYTNNGIAWLTPKDLSVKCNKFTARGETDITEDGYKNSSAKLMPRGSVLFSSRAPIGYISIAKGYICTNQGFKSVVPTYAGTAYIYYWLLENTDAIESQASGSTFKEASGSLMKSFPALVPEKSVLDSFEKELAPILNEQEVLEKEIYHAEQIRNSLLPRLMSGELVMNC